MIKHSDPSSSPDYARRICPSRCPVCGRKTWRGYLCCTCGYNAAEDYSTYLTLSAIPGDLHSLEWKQDQYLSRREADRTEPLSRRIAELEEGYDAKFSEIQNLYDTKLAEMQNLYDTKLSEVQNRYDAKFSEVQNRYDVKFSEMQNLYDVKLSEMQTICDALRQQMKDLIAAGSKPQGTVSPSGKGHTIADEIREQLAQGKEEISFGRYESGNGIRPILWYVLSQDPDGTVLLLSKYILDARPYHTARAAGVNWINCSLRNWLNHHFLDTAFSEEERRYMIGSHPASGQTEPVTLLSRSQTAGISSEIMAGKPTSYAATQGLFVMGSRSIWWLKDAPLNSGTALAVQFSDMVPTSATAMTTPSIGVRPAVRIQLSL